MSHQEGLHDRAELIEPWIGLGLMVSAFVLAFGSCPYNSYTCDPYSVCSWVTELVSAITKPAGVSY